jgi:hypothetical protein
MRTKASRHRMLNAQEGIVQSSVESACMLLKMYELTSLRSDCVTLSTRSGAGAV